MSEPAQQSSSQQTTSRVGLLGDLESIFRAEAPPMWRALLAFTGDAEMASDAVAEAFAQAIHRGDAVRSPERWVWKAAYQIAAGELKDRSSYDYRITDMSVEPTEPAWDLRQALSECSPNQRAALVLHYYGGYPAREVARMIGSTPPAVRVHLMRGRRRMRQLLEEVGHE